MPEPKPKFILASASPRRAEILRTIGLDFDVIPSGVDETPREDEAPFEFVMRVARAKALHVAETLGTGLVIGADTIVVVDGHALGKPAGEEEAARMLRLLSGRWHAVMTGVALFDAATSREAVDHAKTLVRFRELAGDEIAAYVATGEPLDKAGAYAIQGRGMLLVEEIAGNYHNVVGFPPILLARLARRFGVVV
jgi:septum formation protein